MSIAQLISLFIIVVGLMSAASSLLAGYKFWEKRSTPGIPFLILKMFSNFVFNLATSITLSINLTSALITGVPLTNRLAEGIIFITAFVISSIGPILFCAQLFGWVDDEWVIKINEKIFPTRKV